MKDDTNDTCCTDPIAAAADLDHPCCPFVRFDVGQTVNEEEPGPGSLQDAVRFDGCRCAGDVEGAVIAAITAVLVRFSRNGLGATNRIEAAVKIMRVTSTTFGEKAIERVFAAHWSPAHVQAFGPSPRPRTVRRWARAAGLEPPATNASRIDGSDT